MIVDHVVSVLAVKRQKKRIECSTMATVRQRKFSKKKETDQAKLDCSVANHLGLFDQKILKNLGSIEKLGID